MTRPFRTASLLCCLLGIGAAVSAQEMRGIRPIPTPEPAARTAILRGPSLRPVAQEEVEQAVAALFAAWNKPELRQMLSGEFYEQTRLPDALAIKVPRDAVVRVLAIDSWYIIQQEATPADPEGTSIEVVSTLSVLVRSQVEYNDPSLGFQRAEGVNEYVFDVSEVMEK